MSDPQRDEFGRFLPKERLDTQPHSEISRTDATIVAAGVLSEEEILRSKGLDPALWEVTSYRTTEWPGGTATRVAARRRAQELAPLEDLRELEELVVRLGVPEPHMPRRGHGNAGLVVNLSDWQVGGTGPGGGSRETIERVLAAGQNVVQYAHDLRAAGRDMDSLVVTGLGDIVEGCTGFYPNQPFSVDLDNRGQIKVSYQLVTALLRMWAPLFPDVRVVPIGGNHGETRSAFKSETGPGDNKDVLTFEIVRSVLEGREGYDHVQWQIPDSELSTTFEVGGTTVGITHGHMFSGGGPNAAAKAERWWKGQTFGLQPVKDATILVSGHFHHFMAQEFSDAGRTWFQAPAMDNGSQWYTEMSGQSSAPGMLVFRAGRGCGPRQWDDLKII